MAITYDEVSKAANQLLTKFPKNSITIEKVRAQLGFRGSNSTICKYLNRWRSDTPSNGNVEVIVDDNFDFVTHLNSALNYQVMAWENAQAGLQHLEKTMLALIEGQKRLVEIVIKYLNKQEQPE